MCCSSCHVPCFRPIGGSSSVRRVDFSSISSCFDASYRNIPINIGAQNYNPLRYSEFSVLLTPASVQTSRSEEHTSELQSLMRISYAVFCLKKTKKQTRDKTTNQNKNKTQTDNTTNIKNKNSYSIYNY